jgi:glutathionyl-hydroquinone reductase
MANSAPETTDDGRYERQPFRFTARITADGRDGWPAQLDRYRLVVSRACPWASRTLVTRRLMGLERAIGLAVADPIQDDRSWRFTLDPGGVDPVLGIAFLADAYYKADPDYDGGVSVPAIVDVGTGAVVTNDVFQVTLDLATEWRAYAREGAPDLYPEPLRAEIDEVNARTYADLNAAVYEAGFATTQAAYEDAYRRVFACLDWLAGRLEGRRYLVGDTITEADIRVFTTLIRFDAVYHGHFTCNRNKITEMPVLWGYLRDLFQTPGFGDTVDFDHIKRHYYQVHTNINPTQLVPVGPDLSGLTSPHGRERLGGRPFGDGTPPGPPPAGEVIAAQL